jgi:hypothetical protein
MILGALRVPQDHAGWSTGARRSCRSPGRLRSGVSPEQTRAELATIADRLQERTLGRTPISRCEWHRSSTRPWVTCAPRWCCSPAQSANYRLIEPVVSRFVTGASIDEATRGPGTTRLDTAVTPVGSHLRGTREAPCRLRGRLPDSPLGRIALDAPPLYRLLC